MKVVRVPLHEVTVAADSICNGDWMELRSSELSSTPQNPVAMVIGRTLLGYVLGKRAVRCAKVADLLARVGVLFSVCFCMLRRVLCCLSWDLTSMSRSCISTHGCRSTLIQTQNFVSSSNTNLQGTHDSKKDEFDLTILDLKQRKQKTKPFHATLSWRGFHSANENKSIETLRQRIS